MHITRLVHHSIHFGRLYVPALYQLVLEVVSNWMCSAHQRKIPVPFIPTLYYDFLSSYSQYLALYFIYHTSLPHYTKSIKVPITYTMLAADVPSVHELYLVYMNNTPQILTSYYICTHCTSTIHCKVLRRRDCTQYTTSLLHYQVLTIQISTRTTP